MSEWAKSEQIVWGERKSTIEKTRGKEEPRGSGEVVEEL